VRLTLAVAVLAAGCVATRNPAPAGDRLSLDERAQALTEVIGLRYERLAADPPVDACSVYLILDRDPSFVRRLGEFARTKLGAVNVASCPASSVDLMRRGHGWYVQAIVLRGPGELTVTAAANAHGGHREVFFLRHGYGDPRLWRVVEVRLADFWFE
jgi:hypothetical protein